MNVSSTYVDLDWNEYLNLFERHRFITALETGKAGVLAGDAAAEVAAGQRLGAGQLGVGLALGLRANPVQHRQGRTACATAVPAQHAIVQICQWPWPNSNKCRVMHMVTRYLSYKHANRRKKENLGSNETHR